MRFLYIPIIMFILSSCSRYAYDYTFKVFRKEYKLKDIPKKMNLNTDKLYVYDIVTLNNKKEKDRAYVLYCYKNNKPCVILSKESQAKTTETKRIKKGNYYNICGSLQTDKNRDFISGESKIFLFETFYLDFQKTKYKFSDIYTSNILKGLYIDE